MRQIKINSVTGSEIITTSNVKDYVRIDTTADDNIIARMIVQARIWCENYISKDIVAKTRSYYIPQTNSGIFDLPFAPVTSIQSITIDGTTASYEILGLDNETIELDSGSASKVKIDYTTAGLSDDLLKQAMLQLVSTYYDNRSDFVSDTKGNIDQVPSATRNILDSYKTMFL